MMLVYGAVDTSIWQRYSLSEFSTHSTLRTRPTPSSALLKHCTPSVSGTKPRDGGAAAAAAVAVLVDDDAAAGAGGTRCVEAGAAVVGPSEALRPSTFANSAAHIAIASSILRAGGGAPSVAAMGAPCAALLAWPLP
eukprot:scaffold663_cov358-Prasinococcus_capsulatus_cf.AAC.6